MNLISEIVRSLTGDFRFPSTYLSRGANCIDLVPGVCTRALGEYIKAEDSEERLSKVFLYETHAEVWRLKDWLESNAHLSQIRRQQEEESRRIFEKERRNRIKTIAIEGIVLLFSKSRAPDAIRLAEAIYAAYERNPKSIENFPDIRREIEKAEKAAGQ